MKVSSGSSASESSVSAPSSGTQPPAPEMESGAGDPGRPTRLEFRYLDGIRGLAALAVMFFHALEFTGRTGEGVNRLAAVTRVVGYGYLGVPIFIVLSGYVLMLPVLATPGLQVPGGFARYVRRRARRILPPYYAALLIVLTLIASVPLLRHPARHGLGYQAPRVTPGAVIAHLLLLHDCRSVWVGKIDGPMWSVAVEWHIYFLMPLVLLPLWRRTHPVLVVGACLLVSTVPSELAFGPAWLIGGLDAAHVWLIGLFAAGMLAAHATLGHFRLPGLGILAPIAGAGLLAALALRPAFQQQAVVSETGTGLVVALLLVWTGRRVLSGARPAHVRILECRGPALLGLISYSVYLLHSPVLALANLATLSWGFNPADQWALLTFVGVPVDVLVCAGFYWIVERRFKNTRQLHAAEELSRSHSKTATTRGSPDARGIRSRPAASPALSNRRRPPSLGTEQISTPTSITVVTM